METFAPARPLVDVPRFIQRRNRVLSGLAPDELDAPVRTHVARLNARPCCFTLQCCWGHFVHGDQPDETGLAPPPDHDVGDIDYRIAYLALAVDNDRDGIRLLDALATVVRVDPDNVQFGSPAWFWDRHPNAYALQVEPIRFSHLDHAIVGHREARRLAEVRDEVYEELDRILDAL